MPSLDWFDGFETWAWGSTGDTEQTGRYTGGNFGAGGTNQFGGVLGRYSSRSFRSDSTGGAATMWLARDKDKNGSALSFTEFTQQVHLFINDSQTVAKTIMGVAETSALTVRHLELAVGTGTVGGAFDLLVNRAGTTLTTCTAALQSSQWNMIEIIGKVDDSTGYYHVRVNGTVVATVTGADTRNAGTGTCGAHYFGVVAVSGTHDLRYDDYAFCLSPASSSDFLGDGHEVALTATAAGNYADFTPLSSTRVSNVDEAQPDDDTTYNYSATAGNRDSFAMTNSPAQTQIVHGVQTFLRARKDDAGTRTAKQFMRASSTNYEDSTITLNDSYLTHARCMPTNPATSAAWTQSEVDALELGYKVEA